MGGGGTVTSDPAMLTVNDAFMIYTQSPSQALPAGSDAVFSVYAGGEDLSYQWYYSRDGQNWARTTVEGAKTKEIRFKATAARNGNWYRCEVTGAGETLVSAPARLTVYEEGETVIYAQAESGTYSPGQSAYFWVSAKGKNLSYQWYYSKDGQNWSRTTVSGAKTNEITVEATSARNGNWYYCEVTGTGGTVTSAPVMLAVDESTRIIYHPGSQTVPAGQYASFYVYAGGKDLSYQWYYSKDGQNWYKTTVEGAKTNRITVKATSARNGNWYRCEVTGDGGTVTSIPVRLTVEPVMITDQSVSRAVTAGNDVDFWVVAEGENLSYQWYYSKDGQNWSRTTVEGAKTAQIRLEATTARNGNWYRCEVTGDGGKAVSDPVRLIVIQK